MYIWVALTFEKEFEDSLRKYAKMVGLENNLDLTAFYLPQHITLKISFPCKDSDVKSITEYLMSYLSKTDAFDVEVDKMELLESNYNIIWMNIAESDILRKLHNEINQELLDNYKIGLHDYDGENFKFHSTLFIDNVVPITNYRKAIKQLQKFDFIRNQTIKSACIGCSKSGKIGSYEISEIIYLNNKR